MPSGCLPVQARRYIAGYGRAPASTVGSVVLTDLASGASWEGVDVATVSGPWRRCAPHLVVLHLLLLLLRRSRFRCYATFGHPTLAMLRLRAAAAAQSTCCYLTPYMLILDCNFDLLVPTPPSLISCRSTLRPSPATAWTA